MKHYSLIGTLLLFLSSQTLFSQSLRDYERAGDNAFERQDYGAAVQHYSDVLRRREDDLSLWWKYGESARLYNSYLEAERSYRKISDTEAYANQHPLVDYRLAEVKKGQGDYETAIVYFEKFIAEKPKTEPVYFELAKAEIENCHLAQAIAASPLNVTVNHLGKDINSPFYDFAPIVVGDTLYYSSNRFDKKSFKGKQKRKVSKVLQAINGRRGKEPGRGFPATDTAHIAHTAFSPDGHYVFFTVCKDLNINEKHCELWMTMLDKRDIWLPAIKLPEPINLPGYNTTQPNIAFDEHEQGLVLWFASDRPGGKGKLDLWSTPLDTNYFCPCMLPMLGQKKITRFPTFKAPVNHTELNTPENEATPFFFSRDQKLFYSSDGLPGLGGFDIFYSKKEKDQLSAPQNIGSGLNTSYNDLYLVLKKDGLNGYLSSNRPGSLFLDEKNQACCNDIFSFKLESSLPQGPAATIAIPELPIPLEPVTQTKAPALPEVAPIAPIVPIETAPKLSLADFNGLSLYFDNDQPEQRSRKTSTLLSYSATAKSFLDRQNVYQEQFASGLDAEQAVQAKALVAKFFENDIKYGHERLQELCNALAIQLAKGEKVEVVLKGFASPRANSDYNQILAKRRISSLRNEFEAFNNGALRAYIQSGQLIISELSFGETIAKPGVSDQLQDVRNSIYHPEAARERRVEIVEVRTH